MIKGISAFFFVTLGILFLAAPSFANNPLDRYFGKVDTREAFGSLFGNERQPIQTICRAYGQS